MGGIALNDPRSGRSAHTLASRAMRDASFRSAQCRSRRKLARAVLRPSCLRILRRARSESPNGSFQLQRLCGLSLVGRRFMTPSRRKRRQRVPVQTIHPRGSCVLGNSRRASDRRRSAPRGGAGRWQSAAWPWGKRSKRTAEVCRDCAGGSRVTSRRPARDLRQAFDEQLTLVDRESPDVRLVRSHPHQPLHKGIGFIPLPFPQAVKCIVGSAACILRGLVARNAQGLAIGMGTVRGFTSRVLRARPEEAWFPVGIKIAQRATKDHCRPTFGASKLCFDSWSLECHRHSHAVTNRRKRGGGENGGTRSIARALSTVMLGADLKLARREKNPPRSHKNAFPMAQIQLLDVRAKNWGTRIRT